METRNLAGQLLDSMAEIAKKEIAASYSHVFEEMTQGLVSLNQSVADMQAVVQPKDNPNQRISLREASEQYGIQKVVLREAIMSGVLPFEYKNPLEPKDGYWLIKRADLDSFNTNVLLRKKKIHA